MNPVSRIDPSSPLVAVTGLKHSGKSTIGVRVARSLDLPFLDLDDEALRLLREQLPRPESGSTLRDYFAEYGGETFRKYEAETLRSLLEDRFSGLIACGGGIVDNPSAMKLLEGAALIVYLTAEFSILYERIIRGGVPPFLDPRDPRGSFMALAQRRDAAYRSAADVVVPLGGLDIGSAANVVATAIKEQMHAG